MLYLPCAHSRRHSGCHGEDHNLRGRGPPPQILPEITLNVKGAFILPGTGVTNQGVGRGPQLLASHRSPGEQYTGIRLGPAKPWCPAHAVPVPLVFQSLSASGEELLCPSDFRYRS